MTENVREEIHLALRRGLATQHHVVYRISIQARFTIPATPIGSGALYLTCACMGGGQWPWDAYEQEGRRYGEGNVEIICFLAS
jgi:hypothetical protein